MSVRSSVSLVIPRSFRTVSLRARLLITLYCLYLCFTAVHEQPDLFRISGAPSNPSRCDFASDEIPNLSGEQLDRVMKRMYNELSIEDRKFHFRTYHRVFVGKEAVSFLVEQGIVRSRPDGVVLGERLRARGDFHHVTKEHVFHDKELFYRFAMDE